MTLLSGTEHIACLCLSLSFRELLYKHLVSQPQKSLHSWAYQKSWLSSNSKTGGWGSAGEEPGARFLLGLGTYKGEEETTNTQQYHPMVHNLRAVFAMLCGQGVQVISRVYLDGSCWCALVTRWRDMKLFLLSLLGEFSLCPQAGSCDPRITAPQPPCFLFSESAIPSNWPGHSSEAVNREVKLSPDLSAGPSDLPLLNE